MDTIKPPGPLSQEMRDLAEKQGPSRLPTKADGTGLGTADLPDEVVSQELGVSVWVANAPGKTREGPFAIGVSIGGRENPELTANERRYVAAALRRAAERMEVQGH